MRTVGADLIFIKNKHSPLPVDKIHSLFIEINQSEYYNLFGGIDMKKTLKIIIIVIAVVACIVLTFSVRLSGNIKHTDVNLGNSDVLSEESLQSAANVILDEIGSWHGVKRVYDVTYCGDEKSADSLDYCIELGEKNYTECAVFKSDFLTANSVQSGGWNPNDVYTDWQWYLAKTENGEWELLTCGY